MQRLSHNSTGQLLVLQLPEHSQPGCPHGEAGSNIRLGDTALTSAGKQGPPSAEIVQRRKQWKELKRLLQHTKKSRSNQVEQGLADFL